MKKPRLLLAAAHSGAGKTSVAAGLMSALVRRGQTVQPYKAGPDYIDPAFHTFVTGRQSRNLDSWMLDQATVLALFGHHAPEAGQGLSIIEGVMGLFDGHLEEAVGSSAHLARILAAPVVLVINGAGLARSAAALVRGFDRFEPGLRLAGVIINQTSSAAHYNMLKSFVENEAGVSCFGHLLKNPALALESRHLGLVPAGEVADLSARLGYLAEAAAATLDLDGLVKLAEAAPELDIPPLPGPAEPPPPVRLGLARDAAFNFYYQDALDLLVRLGAELVAFSPLADTALPPDLAGLYLGGGFPEIFAKDLAANRGLREEIRQALEDGLPAYAECGGLMYLARTLVDKNGQAHEMTGFFPVTTVMGSGLKNFGYATVVFEAATVLGPAGTRVRGHEFHHSRIADETEDYVLRMEKSPGRTWRGGLARKNVLAAYPHIHFAANPALAVNFLENCRAHRLSKI